MNMRKNGFTLVEAIIAIAVGAIIMAAIYGYMSLVQKNSANMDRKVVTLQDTRAVLDLMAGEIRMASYDPQGRPRAIIWNTIPACAQMVGWGGTAVPDNRGIQVANANTIFIAMDLDEDGTIGNAGASSEYIMYSYDGANTLYRECQLRRQFGYPGRYRSVFECPQYGKWSYYSSLISVLRRNEYIIAGAGQHSGHQADFNNNRRRYCRH